jgi:hypothetical protein
MEFEGAESVCNYSNSLSFFVADSFNAPAALTGNYDLLECDCEEGTFYFINEESPAGRIKISGNDTAWYINDKLYSLKVTEAVDLNPWLMKKNKKDLSHLRLINVDRNLNVKDITFLKKLAELKPDVGFVFLNDEDKVEDIAQMFNPRYLLRLKLHNNNIQLLEGMTNLEYLWASVEEEDLIKALPAIPSLRSILLSCENRLLPEDFLSNNPQIEKVIVYSSENFDFNVLSPIENLKEFTLLLSDSLVNTELINRHRELKSLNINAIYNPWNIKLPRLRYVTINSEVSQTGFDNFLMSHPHLEAIEITNNQHISDLHHLADLKKLRALSIIDTVTDIASIKNLSKLKYLSLPDDYLGNSGMKAEIQQSLPGTRLAANQGFCLGSGWLLLLLPLIFLFWVLQKRIDHRKTFP